ncbi:MAG: hypothetical protein H6651_20860 [Ardenticatenales bacterium]|nr:hypothetical protein [Ardenticatenales bacterium]
MASRQHRELEYAFLALTILSGVYVAYTIISSRNGTAPAGGHPFGHWLGIIGTIFMVMTELLYSIRKRTRLLNRAGPVRAWLSFHIFTGIVGPFMVLMHTGLQFRGLAGVTMMLTVLIVFSGFVGRYLYAALQRAGLQSEDSYASSVDQIAGARAAIKLFEEEWPARVREIEKIWQSKNESRPAFMAPWNQFRMRQRLNRLEGERTALNEQLNRYLQQKQRLESNLGRNATYQKLFRLWHLVHVPMGITLFVAVAIHIAATIFFRAGLFR